MHAMAYSSLMGLQGNDGSATDVSDVIARYTLLLFADKGEYLDSNWRRALGGWACMFPRMDQRKVGKVARPIYFQGPRSRSRVGARKSYQQPRNHCLAAASSHHGQQAPRSIPISARLFPLASALLFLAALMPTSREHGAA